MTERTTKQQLWPINTKENKRLALNALTAVMGSEGKEVIIRKRIENKTTEQRNSFHTLAGIFASEVGYTKEQIKRVILKEVYGTEVVLGTEVGKSSESLTRGDYSHLIEQTYVIAGSMGIVLPLLAP